MKKQFLSLLALSLCAVSQVWADDPTVFYRNNYEPTDGTPATPDWTSSNGRFVPIIYKDADGNSYCAADVTTTNNNGTTMVGPALKCPAGNFTILMDLRFSNSGNPNAQEPFEIILQDAGGSNLLDIAATAKEVSTWKINGMDNALDLPTTQFQDLSKAADLSELNWYRFQLTWKDGTTFLSIHNETTNKDIIDKQIIPSLSQTGGAKQMVVYTKRYLANFGIDNVTVRSVEDSDIPAITLYEYTVKYVCDGVADPLKTFTGSGPANADITLTANDKAPIYVNGQKYVYVSDNTSEVKAGENAVVTVKYKAAENFKYTINIKAGEEALEYASATGVEKDLIYVDYPRFVAASNGDLYTKAANSSQFQTSFELTENNQVYEMAYTATTTKNVIFCSEAEKIAGLTKVEGGTIKLRSSAAAAAIPNKTEDVKFATISQSGVYQMVVGIMGTAKDASSFKIKIGDKTVTATSQNVNISETTFEIKVPDATTVDCVVPASTETVTNGNGLDYIYIFRTGDYSEDSSVTGINASKPANESPAHDLMGRRLQKPQKGLVIQNGRLKMIR